MIFFTKNQNLKKNFFLGGGGGGGGVDQQTDEQAQTNLRLQLLRSLGALQCINIQVMALTSSIYDYFII